VWDVNCPHVDIPLDLEGMRTGNYYYLSKNGKFFIIFDAGPLTEHTVKAFCEIHD
jgi:hypothetical protein